MNYLPIQPLINALPEFTIPEISRKAGVDRSGLHRAMKRGTISRRIADIVASAHGLRLADIYGDGIPQRSDRQLAIDRVFRQMNEHRRGSRPCADKVPVAPLMHELDRQGLSINEAAIQAGMSRRTLLRAVADGHLTVYAADIAATRILGVHPVNLWGDDWLNLTDCRHELIDNAFARLHQEAAR